MNIDYDLVEWTGSDAMDHVLCIFVVVVISWNSFNITASRHNIYIFFLLIKTETINELNVYKYSEHGYYWQR